MNRVCSILIAAALAVLPAQTAFADEGNGIGIGTGVFGAVGNGPGTTPGTGLHLTWDPGFMFLEGAVNFFWADNAVTNFDIGVKGYFPIARGDRSDFSLGGEVSVGVSDPQGGAGVAGAGTDALVTLGAGGRIRIFATENVAIGVDTGLRVLIVENGARVAVGDIFGGVFGGASVTYFFGSSGGGESTSSAATSSDDEEDYSDEYYEDGE